MRQWWRDLLFAHWPLPPEALAPLLPSSLVPDTFDGQAWVAVVPFRMTGIRPPFFPPVPGISAFLELNVRTYVRPRDLPASPPGVYFWSLDASSPPAVWGARTFFHLAYQNARMSLANRDGWIDYTSQRTHRGSPPARLSMRYRALAPSVKTPLTHFLTERYCLYTTDSQNRLYRGDIQHASWPLEDAEARFETNTMAEACGLALPRTVPLLHFARALSVSIFPLRRLG